MYVNDLQGECALSSRGILDLKRDAFNSPAYRMVDHLARCPFRDRIVSTQRGKLFRFYSIKGPLCLGAFRSFRPPLLPSRFRVSLKNFNSSGSAVADFPREREAVTDLGKPRGVTRNREKYLPVRWIENLGSLIRLPFIFSRSVRKELKLQRDADMIADEI